MDSFEIKFKSAFRNPKSAILICAMLFALCFPARAQEPRKVPRIGYLSTSPVSSNLARREAFRQGLRDLGNVEGKNIVIEWRNAEGKPDRNPALAAELVRLKVDVIVAAGDGGTRAAKKATSTIPIVMVQGGDPVGSGFVASLAQPGGNITGLAILRPELSGKRLEILREVVPKLSRVAVFVNSTSTDYAQTLKEIELAAGTLGVKLKYLDIRSPKDFETAFRDAVKGRAEAILFRVPGSILSPQRIQIAELAFKRRLPAIYDNAEDVEAGGLMSYGVSIPDLFRRAATYVDKILKGANPADLPVEQPLKFEVIINHKAANQIGLTIPPKVLVRGDRVIR
jgi:putative ABC transport system substrate-binding protein